MLKTAKIFGTFFISLLIPIALYADQQPSLTEAIGQMMMVGFNGTTIDEHSPIVKEIKQYHIGGVIIADHYNQNGKSYTRNIENPQQLKKLISQLQYYARKYTGFPLFIAVNQEGGLINALKSSKGFDNANDPSQADLGKTNLQAVFQETYKRAVLLKLMGINVDLAPVADLNINPNNPAIGELQRSFGRDPEKVTKDLQAAIRAYHKAHVLCTLKHFPGLGSAEQNTDYASADISKTWQEEELLPYKNLIDDKLMCTFVMTSHAIIKRLDPSGLPASFSKKIVTDLLVNKLHFNGLIMTDDMDAVALSRIPFVDAIDKVITAGNHIIIYDGTQGHGPDNDAEKLFHTMTELAEKNPHIRQQIFKAYAKIIAVKKMMH